VTKGERKSTKRMTFQLQYGAGAKSMSEKLGLTKAIAQGFIEAYYGRYSRLAEWQADIMEAVKRSRKPSEGRLPSGLPQGRGQYESPTGRVYVFLEKDKPEGWRGKDTEPDFNPPEVKNYPIQGFATGDIMALYRGKVYRRMLALPDLLKKALPINTVHDSVMFDCYDKETAERMKLLLVEEAAKLPATIHELWGIKAILPLKIEVKAGPNWAETEII
jgi:DNA polymerase-1